MTSLKNFIYPRSDSNFSDYIIVELASTLEKYVKKNRYAI